MIEFKLTGNWSVAKSELRNLPLKVKSAGSGAQRKIAQKIVRLAKEHIASQDLGWKPKQKKDGMVLYDTGAYYHAIRSWKEGDTYHAGIPLGSVNAKGVPIIIYALVHEFGNPGKGIPARPLWRPIYQEMGGKKGIAKIVRIAILSKLVSMRQKGFTV